MKKPKIKLSDPTYLSLDDPRFTDAKAAIGRRCKTESALSSSGQVYYNVEGLIVAVDSRPFKGGKDDVYVGIKVPYNEFYLYAQFSRVELLPPSSAVPGPVIPRDFAS